MNPQLPRCLLLQLRELSGAVTAKAGNGAARPLGIARPSCRLPDAHNHPGIFSITTSFHLNTVADIIMLGTATCVFLAQKVIFAKVKVLKNIARIVNATQVSQCQYDLRFSCDRNVNILRKVHNQPFPLLPFCIKGFLDFN